jgi:hypothetical protein
MKNLLGALLAALLIASTANAAVDQKKTIPGPDNRQQYYPNFQRMTIGDLGFGIQILNSGTLLGGATWFNFTGSGCTASLAGGTATINCTGGGPGGTGGAGVSYFDRTQTLSIATFTIPYVNALYDQSFATFPVFGSTAPITGSWQVKAPSFTIEGLLKLSSNTISGSSITVAGLFISSNGFLVGGVLFTNYMSTVSAAINARLLLTDWLVSKDTGDARQWATELASGTLASQISVRLTTFSTTNDAQDSTMTAIVRSTASLENKVSTQTMVYAGGINLTALVQGANITLTQSGSSLTIAGGGASGITTDQANVLIISTYNALVVTQIATGTLQANTWIAINSTNAAANVHSSTAQARILELSVATDNLKTAVYLSINSTDTASKVHSSTAQARILELSIATDNLKTAVYLAINSTNAAANLHISTAQTVIAGKIPNTAGVVYSTMIAPTITLTNSINASSGAVTSTWTVGTNGDGGLLKYSSGIVNNLSYTYPSAYCSANQLWKQNNNGVWTCADDNSSAGSGTNELAPKVGLQDGGQNVKVSSIAFVTAFSSGVTVAVGTDIATYTILGATNPYRSISIPAGSWYGCGQSLSSATKINGGFVVTSSPAASYNIFQDAFHIWDAPVATTSFVCALMRMPYEWAGDSVAFQAIWTSTGLSGRTIDNLAGFSFGAVAFSSGTSRFSAITSTVTTFSAFSGTNTYIDTGPTAAYNILGSPRGGQLVKFVVNAGGGGFNGLPLAIDISLLYRQSFWDGRLR